MHAVTKGYVKTTKEVTKTNRNTGKYYKEPMRFQSETNRLPEARENTSDRWLFGQMTELSKAKP